MTLLNKIVSGRSILASPAKLLKSNVTSCTYLEYLTLCDFLEAAILHDQLYIVGDFNDREKEALSFRDKLNKSGEEFIFNLDDSQDTFSIDDNNIDVRLKEIISNSFHNEISFIRKQLIPYNYTNRYNDDEKIDYIKKVVDLCDKKTDITLELEQLFIKSFRSARTSEFTKHLFRSVVIAAVASLINGTAKFTGSRKPLGTLIIKNNPHFHFNAPTYLLYKKLNLLYIANQKHLIESEKITYAQPLLLSLFLSRLKKKEEAFELIMELRREFKDFREKNIQIFNNLDDKTAKIKLATTYKYFYEINRLGSVNNFRNLIKKNYKEILLDDPGSIDYEFDESDKESKSSTTTSIAISKIIKNFIKFIIEFVKFSRIKKNNIPVIVYFLSLMQFDLHSFGTKLVQINEFYKNKMKRFDMFINKYNN